MAVCESTDSWRRRMINNQRSILCIIGDEDLGCEWADLLFTERRDFGVWMVAEFTLVSPLSLVL